MAVTVTITPDGQPVDLTIDGHSIGYAVNARDASLTIVAGHSPQLALALTVDEIVVKAPATADKL